MVSNPRALERSLAHNRIVHNTYLMQPDLRLDEQLCFALYSASRATTAAYRDALVDAGLTYPQYLVMLALWEDDGLSVGALGRRLHLDSGTLSPLLARLESAGFVSRSRPDRDGRRVVVHLTPAGAELRGEAERIQCALLDRLDMSLEDIVTLRDLANRLTASVTTHSQPAAS